MSEWAFFRDQHENTAYDPHTSYREPEGAAEELQEYITLN